MGSKESIINKIEKGRAEFAYRCAKEGVSISELKKIDNEYYKDDKYASYVKKIPSMILSNGLGQTLAFIVSKRKKSSGDQRPGTEKNPKNAYDLIYKQLSDYFRSEYPINIAEKLPDNMELLEWVISRNSTKYRYITTETLALFNWLRRFAEGMIEGEEKSHE